MGTWGTGIFDDDVAADVRDVWQAAIDEGASPAEASAEVMSALGSDYAEDDDDGPVFWFALAALQLDAGVVDPQVSDRARSAVFKSVSRWRDEADPRDAEEREEVLNELTRRLAAAPVEVPDRPGTAPKRRAASTTQRSKRREPKVGDVLQVALPDGTFAYGRVLEDAGVAFYRERTTDPERPPIGSRDYEFVVAVTDPRRWPIVGYDPSEHLADDWPPPSIIEDELSGTYEIYERGKRRPAVGDEWRNLERMAVWQELHIVDRLLGDRRWQR